ncbi:MAG: hypothetical protein OXI24_09465, partial [Candidatus Poribacteria bacterium]|nr:hypothetical protein [Candidatus Poribacteria bacterium]
KDREQQHSWNYQERCDDSPRQLRFHTLLLFYADSVVARLLTGLEECTDKQKAALFSVEN